MRRTVAVTGIGVISCAGIGAGSFWDGLCRSVPEPEGTVPGFDPAAFLPPGQARRLDRVAQLGLAAAQLAMDGAGSERAGDPRRCGVVFGTGFGGLGSLEEQIRVHQRDGPRRVSAYTVPMVMPNAATAAIAARYGWQGPAETISTACAASTHAITAAARLVETGRCQVVMAGGAEAARTPGGLAAFSKAGAVSAAKAGRPFDLNRDGFVLAEGAAALILEDLAHARARGVPVLAVILGGASTCDAYHVTAPRPDGSAAAYCMELALADAGAAASDVSHVNAHGTGTGPGDAAEAEALWQVFGAAQPPVTSIKGATGHSLGASGAIEAVASVMAIASRLVPPTAGHDAPDPGIRPLDVVARHPRPAPDGLVLSNSFGFGGHNGSLVIGPPP